MKATKSASLVASEPRVSMIPTFHTNNSSQLYDLERASRSMPDLESDLSESFQKSTQKSHCTCPHILAADDDLFQHIYYKGIFQRALKSEGLSLESEDPCIKTCFSGEELIENLDRVRRCGCGTTKLVIIDYQMGEKKLNGVETSVKARNDGYKGPLFLRTSETKGFLKENHKNFEQLLQGNIINMLINKSDVSFAQKFIHQIFT